MVWLFFLHPLIIIQLRNDFSGNIITVPTDGVQLNFSRKEYTVHQLLPLETQKTSMFILSSLGLQDILTDTQH